MITTSNAQFTALNEGNVPPLEQIRDRVWVIPLAMTGTSPLLRYTLTYLLADDEGRLHVVDPGTGSDANWTSFWAAVRELPVSGEIGSIIVTHMHADHLGLASRLQEATGAPLMMHALEIEALDAPEVDVLVHAAPWGVPEERLPEIKAIRALRQDAPPPPRPDAAFSGVLTTQQSNGLELEILHTPGHTSGSICIRLPGEKLLLSGDHILPMLYPGIGLGATTERNPLADYDASLSRVLGFDDHEVLPGHGYRFTGLADRIDRIRAHHQRRNAEVAGAITRTPDASVYEVAAQLTWSRGWENVRGVVLYSALRQTSMHIGYIRTQDLASQPAT